MSHAEFLEKLDRIKLPAGKICGQCVNYDNNCSWLLRSDIGPLDTSTTICYFEPNRFNVPFAYALSPEEIAKIRSYRRQR